MPEHGPPTKVFMGRRPAADLLAMPPRYAALLQDCWASDARARPTFTEIIPRVRDLVREERSGRAAADPSLAAGAPAAAAGGAALRASGVGAGAGLIGVGRGCDGAAKATTCQGAALSPDTPDQGPGGGAQAHGAAGLQSGPGRPGQAPGGSCSWGSESESGLGFSLSSPPDGAATGAHEHLPQLSPRPQPSQPSPFALDAERRALSPLHNGRVGG